MPELIQTLKAVQKEKAEERKFVASLKGITLNEEEKNDEGSTFQDVALKAAGIDAKSDDVVSLQGRFAAEAGFGIGAGLGYFQE